MAEDFPLSTTCSIVCKIKQGPTTTIKTVVMSLWKLTVSCRLQVINYSNFTAPKPKTDNEAYFAFFNTKQKWIDVGKQTIQLQ